MKATLNKIFSVLLAVCFVLSAIPAPAAAAEIPTNAVTNGEYVNGVWTPGGDGSITHTIGDTPVTLSKTATVVGENTFDITLKVQTSTSTSTVTNSGAVVLVIDLSNSMDYCAECRGESRHRDGCKYDNPQTIPFIGTVHSEVTASQSRLVAAKAAAANFLRNYAGEDAGANRQLAIVYFATNYRTVMSWANVAGGTGKNSFDTAMYTINNLSLPSGDSGGTNLEGGLKTALDNLPEVSDYGSKSVVLLTDGIPTYRIGGGSGQNGSQSNNNAAANQATAIKNAGAKLYTVCFGVADQNTYNGGPTVGNFLSGSVASSGCAYNADSSNELYAAFQAISESITSGLSGDGWTATDPMADMITVTGGTGDNFSGVDGTYTWKLTNATTSTNGNVTTYTYTHTYRVTLNVQGESFEEGKFFPTNEPTYLNVDGKQYAFPVPGVTGVLPRTDVTVTKVWDDAENQDGKRTESVTVQLKQGENLIGEKVTLDASNNWTYTWDGETYNLISHINNQPVAYTVVEDEVAGYTPAVTSAEENPFALTLTNTHEIEKTSVSMTKVWNDANDQDGKRPESIKVQLLKNGVPTGDPVTVTGTEYTFENLDKYENGQVITYTVEEIDVDENYTASYSEDGLTVTNTHEVEKTSVTVTKKWEDNNDQDGIRPTEITVQLLANGEPTNYTATMTGTGNEWTYTFTGLDVNANGKAIEYTVAEVEVPEDYSSDAEGLTVTNTHEVEKTSVTVTKKWEDNNNQDGIRPTEITVQLLANGEPTNYTATMTGTGNEWTYTFTGLDKNANGKAIEYTVAEVEVPEDYSSDAEGLTVTNTHEPEKTSVSVTKVWNDNDDQDGKRPESITVSLLADGNDTGKTLTLSTANNWTGSFTDLDKYAAGQEIAYTVAESEVTGYKLEGITAKEDGYTITNVHEIEKTSVSGSKTWADNDDQDGKRPEEITINLKANGEVVATKTVTADDNWAWTFENLDKYAKGQEIVYTVSEGEVEGYVTSYNGLNVTNTYNPEKTSVSVTKVWKDDSNRDGIRPADITVKLLADGKATNKTLTLSSGNDWTATFEDLDKYANKGTEIKYTIEEVEVKGYTSKIDGDAANGYTLINTHEIETVSVEGSKTWADNDDQDGKRPEEITINLKANGEVVATKTVTVADDWAWSFTNLPKNENGNPINYTISEDAVEGYTAEVKGYDVTNSYTPETTSVHVTKVWLDNEDQDGIRPEVITVTLVADGVETNKTLKLSAENKWTGTFKDLDKFADGVEIKYTVKETTVEGYESEYEVKADGITITNIHEPEVIEKIVGKKTWDDANNQDGKRPEEITVNLKANGIIVATKTVSEADSWIYSFENLDKYENGGNEIVYTVEEASVEGYSAKYDGYNITNSYTPETMNIKVTKSWVDSNDADKIRPTKVTIYLLANGEKTGDKLVLTAGDKWTGSFTDLPKYEDGKAIKYTIEEKAVKDYKAVVKGTAEDGFTVTNSHTTIPKTGDERTPILWISMMALGIIAVFFATRPFFVKKGKYSR